MANQDDERDEDERDETEGSDDEGSDEEGSDDGAEESSDGESSDDESSDDDSSDDEEASAAPRAPADAVSDPVDAPQAPTTAASRAAATAKAKTAGARIAAAKAAKAAKKAVKKAELKEERAAQLRTPEPAPTAEQEEEDAVEQIKESALGQAAIHAQDWAKSNEKIVYGVLGVAALALVGWFGYSYVNESNAVAAGAALDEAVRISRAEIREEGEDEPSAEDEDEVSFATVEERSTAALEAYRRVISQHGSTDAAGWARLGEARLLLESGEAEDARGAFQAAIASHGADPVVAMRAYEGIGFTYEEEENWEEARESFERIRDLDNGAYAAVADYNLARVRLATGDEVGAQTALEALVDSIRESSDSAEPEFPYVLAQAQTLLRELDPSSADGAEAPALGAGASEEEIMEMIRRAMEGRGGAPPGGE